MSETPLHLLPAEQQIAQMHARIAELTKALTDIAQGNVPPGFLSDALLANKAAFQEAFATWMQATARSVLPAAQPTVR
jgi:hypothetical protein